MHIAIALSAVECSILCCNDCRAHGVCALESSSFKKLNGLEMRITIKFMDMACLEFMSYRPLNIGPWGGILNYQVNLFPRREGS